MALTPIIDLPEITVYGPPDSLSIVTDIGPAGPRGSKIFANIGDPDSYTLSSAGAYSMNGEALKVGDMYYRIDNASFYQWVKLPTGLIWESRAGFNNYFRTSMNVEFVDGIGSATVSLTDLWVDTGIADILNTSICTTVTAISTERAYITVTSKSLSLGMPRNLLLEFFGFKVIPESLTTSALNATVELNIATSLIV